MTATRQNELLSRDQGTIDQCPFQDCGHTCCDFSQGNYILLYPGELAQAVAERRGVGHLEIADDGMGGHRAVCRAANTATCDNGYKPLDCASYPFFPRIDEAEEIVVVDKGAKCPLRTISLNRHRRWVADQWRRVATMIPQVGNWLRVARPIGYSDTRTTIVSPK